MDILRNIIEANQRMNWSRPLENKSTLYQRLNEYHMRTGIKQDILCKAAIIQNGDRFIEVEKELERECDATDDLVDYEAPPPEEYRDSDTANRRRAMRLALDKVNAGKGMLRQLERYSYTNDLYIDQLKEASRRRNHGGWGGGSKNQNVS